MHTPRRPPSTCRSEAVRTPFAQVGNAEPADRTRSRVPVAAAGGLGRPCWDRTNDQRIRRLGARFWRPGPTCLRPRHSGSARSSGRFPFGARNKDLHGERMQFESRRRIVRGNTTATDPSDRSGNCTCTHCFPHPTLNRQRLRCQMTAWCHPLAAVRRRLIRSRSKTAAIAVRTCLTGIVASACMLVDAPPTHPLPVVVDAIAHLHGLMAPIAKEIRPLTGTRGLIPREVPPLALRLAKARLIRRQQCRIRRRGKAPAVAAPQPTVMLDGAALAAVPADRRAILDRGFLHFRSGLLHDR